MNERRNTKCPLCGAPAVVRITGEPDLITDDLHACVSVSYDEPKPRMPTIRGYEMPHLNAVAELLHRHGVTPEDLCDLVSNFERAFIMVAEITRRDTERQFRELQEGFLKQIAFAGAERDLGPLKITREQFDEIFKNEEEAKA